MRVDDIFIFEGIREYDTLEENHNIMSEFLGEMVFEGIAEDRNSAIMLLESRADKIIKDYSRRYTAGEPPEVMVFQDRTNPKHYAVLAAGSGMFYRFDIINDKIVSEERYRDFRELLAEKSVLTADNFGPVDTRSYLQKNWKRLLMWLLGGTAVVLIGGPLILAWLATLGSALAFLGQIVLGTGITIAALSGTGWLMQRLQSGEASNDRWNNS